MTPAADLAFELPADVETRSAEERARLAATLRRLADTLHAEADALDGGYLTTQQAAEAIGRSEECVRQWIRRYGIGHLDDRAHRFMVSRSKLIAHLLQTYGRLPHGLAVVVHRELTAELPLIAGHSGQLREVISNLVNNALEALRSTTNRSRVLHVRTELGDRDTIAIAIQDTGPEIDPNKLAGIFGAFVTTKTHGTGLGLAICRMIVERHGGRLTASSDGKTGALFQFILPIEGTYIHIE